MISALESSFISCGVQSNIRIDGRSRQQFRDFVIDTMVLSNANGSCRLCLSGTDVLVGVSLDIDATRDVFDCNVDLAPLAMSRESGLELTQMLARQLSMADKSILFLNDEYSWIVKIDVLVLASNGNMVDSIFIAVKAALMTCMVPKVEWNEDIYEIKNEYTRLNFESVPLCVTMNKIGHSHLVDASIMEEHASTARLHVFVSMGHTHLEKRGEGGIEPSLLSDMSNTGRRIAVEINAKLCTFLS